MKGWLLDTNVISETARPRPDLRVKTWLDDLPRDQIFISILTLGEIEQGVHALPVGHPSRDRLWRFRDVIAEKFTGRTLAVDEPVVRAWAELSGAYRRQFGGRAPVIDTLLAATAQTRDLQIATRNSKDMAALGVRAFNPWADAPSP